MLLRNRTTLLGLVLQLIMACGGVQAGASLQTAGLTAYTETSRDIYLAALLAPVGSSLDNMLMAAGPAAMEYRIATRRISTRGFTSTLLLQTELGTGERTPAHIVAVLDQFKSNLKGALIRGDRFVVALSVDNTTSFYLNETELLRVEDRSVFDHFLAGWLGEFSSAVLRDKLLAGNLNPALQARFEGLAPEQDRLAEIATWMAPAEVIPATSSAQPSTAEKPVATDMAKAVAEQPVATQEPTAQEATATAPATDTSAIATGGTAASVVDKAAGLQTNAADTAEQNPAAVPAETADIAAIEAPGETAVSAAPARAPALAESISVTTLENTPNASTTTSEDGYQKKLHDYFSTVMRKVYGNVDYPRRAINKNRQGKVQLLAHLDETGELLDITMNNSSGFTSLDDAARNAVRQSAPFPEPPVEVKETFVAADGESYLVMIPVTFRLEQ